MSSKFYTHDNWPDSIIISELPHYRIHVESQFKFRRRFDRLDKNMKIEILNAVKNVINQKIKQIENEETTLWASSSWLS